MLASFSKISPVNLPAALVSEFAEYLNFSGFDAPPAELGRFLNFAISAVERHTKRGAFRAEYIAVYSADGENGFKLPVFPAREIISVTVDGVKVSGELKAAGGGYCVSLATAASGTVEVVFSAGYDDAFPLPEVYKAAIFAVGADLWEHRESQSEISLHENKTVKFILQTLDMP